MRAIDDGEFIRGNIPMTKRDVRVFIMDALDIKEGDISLDIGAGTGSVSIEMALRGAAVDSIEVEDEGVTLIKENAKKFGVKINAINGFAPDEICDKHYDKVFIGGTKGRLREIIERVYNLLNPGGVIVLTFILPKNFAQCLEYMKQFKNVESTLISTSSINKIGMMIANNPIFLVRGVK